MLLPIARSAAVPLVLLLLVGCVPSVAGPTAVSPAPPTATPAPAAPDRAGLRPLQLLRDWDRRRAAAYEAGEPRLLRRLYSPGSVAGARDVRVLREYTARGLSVQGLTMQLLDVRLLAASPSVVRLRVVDRVAGGTVVPAGSRRPPVALPVGRPVGRVVTLMDLGPRWVVRSVRRRRRCGRVSGARQRAGR